MKKLYKINSATAEKQHINDGLIDKTNCLRIDYQQTMHATDSNTEVGDAFTKLQQDLTAAAKFKTDMRVRDLALAFYFKLDIITDLLEARRICRATTTRQCQKANSARRLTYCLKGPNPLFAKFTYDRITANKANIITKWNELWAKVNADMPLPRFEEFYRRAFFADSIFKDYEAFDRSPLVYFARKYTCDFAVDGNNFSMKQSTATDSGSEEPLKVLDMIDAKIQDFLDDEGNYIFGLMKKMANAGCFTPDNGYWQEWKTADEVAVNDAKEVEEIIMNVWNTCREPDSYTDEQIENTFLGDSGTCQINMDKNLDHMDNVLAGKSFKHLSGRELCDALQMVNARSTDPQFASSFTIISGMFINDYSLYCYDKQLGLYHMKHFDDEILIDEIQYVTQKYIKLFPNVQLTFEKDITPEGHDDPLIANVHFFVNQQGQWRFEFDHETLSAIAHAFIMAMLTPSLNPPKREG